MSDQNPFKSEAAWRASCDQQWPHLKTGAEPPPLETKALTRGGAAVTPTMLREHFGSYDTLVDGKLGKLDARIAALDARLRALEGGPRR